MKDREAGAASDKHALSFGTRTRCPEGAVPERSGVGTLARRKWKDGARSAVRKVLLPASNQRVTDSGGGDYCLNGISLLETA